MHLLIYSTQYEYTYSSRCFTRIALVDVRMRMQTLHHPCSLTTLARCPGTILSRTIRMNQ